MAKKSNINSHRKKLEQTIEQTMSVIKKFNFNDSLESKDNIELIETNIKSEETAIENKGSNVVLLETKQQSEPINVSSNSPDNQVLGNTSVLEKESAIEQKKEAVINQEQMREEKKDKEERVEREETDASQSSVSISASMKSDASQGSLSVSESIKSQEKAQSQNEPAKDLAVIKPTLKELQEKNFAGLSLTEIISFFTNEIEQLILEDGKKSLSFEEGVATKWEESHPKRTYPALPEIHQIIDIITQRTPLKKYQVFERLILNGLKYTKFIKE